VLARQDSFSSLSETFSAYNWSLEMRCAIVEGSREGTTRFGQHEQLQARRVVGSIWTTRNVLQIASNTYIRSVL
jgi:hypothetical protein